MNVDLASSLSIQERGVVAADTQHLWVALSREEKVCSGSLFENWIKNDVVI